MSAACDERQRVGAEVVVCDAELSDAATVADNFDLRDRKLKGLPIVPETALCHSRAISFQRAEEQGIELRVAVNDMRNWLSGRTYAETAAWAKVLIDKQTDRIVGAHILGHAGEELIHIFALAMKHGITAGDVKDLVYGFPTFSADIKSMW